MLSEIENWNFSIFLNPYLFLIQYSGPLFFHKIQYWTENTLLNHTLLNLIACSGQTWCHQMPKQDGDVSEHIERISSSISKQVTNAKTRQHNFFDDMRDFSEDGGEADESLEDEYLLENYFDESYDRSSHQLKFIFLWV